MAVSINKVTNYNGKTFLGNSSAKPICGIALRTIFTNNIKQAKLSLADPATDIAAPGLPLSITNTNISNNNTTAAGKGLNPNVVTAALATTSIDGFLLMSDTDILELGGEAPMPVDTQVVNVGLLGSGVEVYLPADAALAGVALSTAVNWDTTDLCLKASTATATNLPGVKILSPIVDGIKFKVDTTTKSVGYEDCKVVKVRL